MTYNQVHYFRVNHLADFTQNGHTKTPVGLVSRSQTLFLDARRRRAKKGSGTPPIDNAVLTSTLVGISDDWCKLPLLRLAKSRRPRCGLFSRACVYLLSRDRIWLGLRLRAAAVCAADP